MITTFYPKLRPYGSVTRLHAHKPEFKFYDGVGRYLGSVHATDARSAASVADRIFPNWESIGEPMKEANND